MEANISTLCPGEKGVSFVLTKTVTQIEPDFGMAGDDIFFLTRYVKGPLPKVGDRVLVEAESVTGMPFFKFVAKRVLVVRKDPESVKYESEIIPPAPPLPPTTDVPIHSIYTSEEAPKTKRKKKQKKEVPPILTPEAVISIFPWLQSLTNSKATAYNIPNHILMEGNPEPEKLDETVHNELRVEANIFETNDEQSEANDSDSRKESPEIPTFFCRRCQEPDHIVKNYTNPSTAEKEFPSSLSSTESDFNNPDYKNSSEGVTTPENFQTDQNNKTDVHMQSEENDNDSKRESPELPIFLCRKCQEPGHIAKHCTNPVNRAKLKEYLDSHPEKKAKRNRRRRANQLERLQRLENGTFPAMDEFPWPVCPTEYKETYFNNPNQVNSSEDQDPYFVSTPRACETNRNENGNVKDDGQSSHQSQEIPIFLCRKCQEPGHVAKDCTNPKNKVKLKEYFNSHPEAKTRRNKKRKAKRLERLGRKSDEQDFSHSMQPQNNFDGPHVPYAEYFNCHY